MAAMAPAPLMPLAVHELVARRNVQLHGSNTRAVLAAVVLLLHEEIQLIEAPEGGAVFLVIVGKGLAQPDVGEAAFVADGVTHCRKGRPVGVGRRPLSVIRV